MDLQLDSDIYSNQTNYFFSLLGPRFESAVEQMTSSLEKKFGSKWKPIYVYSAHPGPSFAKDNMVVVNTRAEKIEASLKERVIYLQEYEDLNQEFTSSPLIRETIEQLLKKQERIFLFPFTTAFLEVNDPRVVLIGPDPKIAKQFDDKINQFLLFKELDLPRNPSRIYKTKEELLQNADSIIPCYISASYSSGGNESGLIYGKEMLEAFLARLRDVNATGPFLVADIFEKLVLAPNMTALVTGENDTHVLSITDQILRGNRYLGNVYPSVSSKEHQEIIHDTAKKIGNYLSRQGYRGTFGCDFLINQTGKIVVVDLNPRRQGGYACNVLALESLGVDLTQYELACAIDQTVKIPWSFEQIQYKYAWAHSKLKPSEAGQRVLQDLKTGDMRNAFQHPPSRYEAVFYEPGCILIDGYIGYVVATDIDRRHALTQVTTRANELMDSSLL